MNISQKCQYALRAVFELARRSAGETVTGSQIAQLQAIPPRFLELILGQLRRAGVVESRRGAQGGYRLAVEPRALSVGQVIRFVDGPVAPVRCVAGEGEDCPFQGDCAFMGLWERAGEAVNRVYDETTFQDLIDEYAASGKKYVPGYSI